MTAQGDTLAAVVAELRETIPWVIDHPSGLNAKLARLADRLEKLVASEAAPLAAVPVGVTEIPVAWRYQQPGFPSWGFTESKNVAEQATQEGWEVQPLRVIPSYPTVAETMAQYRIDQLTDSLDSAHRYIEELQARLLAQPSGAGRE